MVTLGLFLIFVHACFFGFASVGWQIYTGCAVGALGLLSRALALSLSRSKSREPNVDAGFMTFPGITSLVSRAVADYQQVWRAYRSILTVVYPSMTAGRSAGRYQRCSLAHRRSALCSALHQKNRVF